MTAICLVMMMTTTKMMMVTMDLLSLNRGEEYDKH